MQELESDCVTDFVPKRFAACLLCPVAFIWVSCCPPTRGCFYFGVAFTGPLLPLGVGGKRMAACPQSTLLLPKGKAHKCC